MVVEFQQIEDDLGLSVDLISGQEEARRIYLGVLSGWNSTVSPTLSSISAAARQNWILGDSHEPRSLSSTKVGAVRLLPNISPPIRSATPSFSTYRLTCAVRSVRLRSCGRLVSRTSALVWWEPLALLNRWRRSTREKSWG